MATKNRSEQQDDPCGKGRDLLCECKTALISEVELLSGAAKSATTARKSKEETIDKKVCCVLKAEETHKVYTNIDYYVAIDAACKTEEIEKNVSEHIKKATKLNDAVKEAVKCLQSIKTKAVELKAKACELDTQIKDECNRPQLDVLNQFFKNKCKVDKAEGGSQFEDFSEIIEYLGSSANKIYDKSNKTFNDGVSISGIQTFSNIDSLKDLSKATTICAQEFKKDIDENVKSSAEKVKTSHSELASCIKDSSLKEIEEHKHSSKYEGVAFTLDFVCCDCKADCRCENVDIDDICCKVMATFCKESNCEDDDKPSYPYQEKNYN